MFKKWWFWVIWLLLSLTGIVVVITWMTIGGDRQLLLVGKTTDAHHQIEMACETCHAAPTFSSANTALKAMNITCRNCHDEELDKADDSHPGKKFRSPRMAAYWENLDGRFCTSCHIEHRPEITRENAVTVAMNFCLACHSEGDQNVRSIRTTHAAQTFDTCASAGCHNYHDNRALYSNFLVKNADEDWLASDPVHELSAKFRFREQPAINPLTFDDAIAPQMPLTDLQALNEWAISGHAQSGINCTHCHAPDFADSAIQSEIQANWIEMPKTEVCNECHKIETKTFRQGRHGMRQHPKIANPRDVDKHLKKLGLASAVPQSLKSWLADPAVPLQMTVAESRVPVHDGAAGLALNCGTCHSSHNVDIEYAAVDACLSCHKDEHSQAYRNSIHYSLWQAETTGEAPSGSGVSCATCHMEKFKRRGEIVTNHNQNDTLRPNEKMIRPVCLDCHGLQFSLDSLADKALIDRNFQGKPSVRVESIHWALQSENE